MSMSYPPCYRAATLTELMQVSRQKQVRHCYHVERPRLILLQTIVQPLRKLLLYRKSTTFVFFFEVSAGVGNHSAAASTDHQALIAAFGGE